MPTERILVCDYCGRLAPRPYWGIAYPWVQIELYRRVSDLERPERAQAVCCSGECASKWTRDEIALWDGAPQNLAKAGT